LAVRARDSSGTPTGPSGGERRSPQALEARAGSAWLSYQKMKRAGTFASARRHAATIRATCTPVNQLIVRQKEVQPGKPCRQLGALLFVAPDQSARGPFHHPGRRDACRRWYPALQSGSSQSMSESSRVVVPLAVQAILVRVLCIDRSRNRFNAAPDSCLRAAGFCRIRRSSDRPPAAVKARRFVVATATYGRGAARLVQGRPPSHTWPSRFAVSWCSRRKC